MTDIAQLLREAAELLRHAEFTSPTHAGAAINRAAKLDACRAELERAESVAHLGGVSMHQEDLNEMMRLPGERVAQQKIQVPTCPRCGERYCGDGVLPCLECKATEKQE